MTDKFMRIVRTKEEAHDAASRAYAFAKMLVAEGKAVHFTCAEDQDPVTVKQYRFFHGPVLKQISEQVVLDGQRYARAVWKKHLKDLLIPDEFEMQRPLVIDKATGKLRPAKKPFPVKKDKSLADFDVQSMSDFIDRVIAYAATEWGVGFRFLAEEREAVRYREPAKKREAAEAEAA